MCALAAAPATRVLNLGDTAISLEWDASWQVEEARPDAPANSTGFHAPDPSHLLVMLTAHSTSLAAGVDIAMRGMVDDKAKELLDAERREGTSGRVLQERRNARLPGVCHRSGTGAQRVEVHLPGHGRVGKPGGGLHGFVQRPGQGAGEARGEGASGHADHQEHLTARIRMHRAQLRCRAVEFADSKSRRGSDAAGSSQD